jgi:hypothetical protein
MRSIFVAALATLVLTVAMSGPASADTYHFLGFYQQDWYYAQAPGAHGPYWSGMTSAADVTPSNGQAGAIYWNSYGNTTVGKAVYANWSGGSCPSTDYSYIFDVYDQYNNYLGRVVTGHLAQGSLTISVGNFAWNGLQIGWVVVLPDRPPSACGTERLSQLDKPVRRQLSPGAVALDTLTWTRSGESNIRQAGVTGGAS